MSRHRIGGDRRPLSSTAPVGGTISGGRAAFLDRDGVLNEAVPDPESGLLESPLNPQDVRLLPGAAAASRRLAKAGYSLVCVSNQPAAAKGMTSVPDLLEVHARVVALLASEGVRLDAWRLCPHHPDGVVPELSGVCDCRKPAPGMLLDVASVLRLDLDSSWMLGDTDSDVVAGRASGCKTALIEYPGSAHKRTGAAPPQLGAVDLPDAVGRILDHRNG